MLLNNPCIYLYGGGVHQTTRVFLLKMIMLGWRLGVPPFKETPSYDAYIYYLHLILRFIISNCSPNQRNLKLMVNGGKYIYIGSIGLYHNQTVIMVSIILMGFKWDDDIIPQSK